jgi:hypothetical protein
MIRGVETKYDVPEERAMKTVNPDPVSIFRESYNAPRFPESWSDDAVTAFREVYAAARQQAVGHELGMANDDDLDPHSEDVRRRRLNDAADLPHDDDDDERADDGGDGTMNHRCSCGHENRVAPPVGHTLKRTSTAVAESEPARVFRESYERIGRAASGHWTET